MQVLSIVGSVERGEPSRVREVAGRGAQAGEGEADEVVPGRLPQEGRGRREQGSGGTPTNQPPEATRQTQILIQHFSQILLPLFTVMVCPLSNLCTWVVAHRRGEGADQGRPGEDVLHLQAEDR